MSPEAIKLNAAESALADLMGRLGQQEEGQTLEDMISEAFGPEVGMPFVEQLANAMLAYQAQASREKDVRHAVIALYLKGVLLGREIATHEAAHDFPLEST